MAYFCLLQIFSLWIKLVRLRSYSRQHVLLLPWSISGFYPGCQQKDELLLLKNPIRIQMSTLKCSSSPTRTLEVVRPVAASSTIPPWTTPCWRLTPPRPVASWRPGVILTTPRCVPHTTEPWWWEDQSSSTKIFPSLHFYLQRCNKNYVGDLFIQRTVQKTRNEDGRSGGEKDCTTTAWIIQSNL